MIAKEGLDHKLPRTENIKARFAVISDVHITQMKEGYDLFDNTMRIMSKLNPNGYIFAGDIVYMIEKAGGGSCDKLYPVVYDYFHEIIEKYIDDVPFVYAIGNHEFPQHNVEHGITQEAKRLFEDKSGCALREHKQICGYHFITLDIESWQCVVPKETEEWAKLEIEKAIEQSGEGPVFVVVHKPLYETVVGSEECALSMSDEFRDFLNSKKQIICITGHVHAPLQDPRCIWQDVCTVVQAPVNAVGNLCVQIDKENITVVPGEPYSQALLADVYDDEVRIYRLDLVEEDIIKKPWIINTKDQSSHRYTNKRYKVSAKPEFDEFNPQVSYEDHKLKVKIKHADCKANHIESMVLYYIVEISDENGNRKFYEKILSDFYVYEKTEFFQFEREICLEGMCYMNITPVSCFNEYGNKETYSFLAI